MLTSMENDNDVTFFIGALGDTDKTFLINLMLAKVSKKKLLPLK